MTIYARQVENSPISFRGAVGGDSLNFFTLIVAMVGSPLFAILEAMGVLDASDAANTADLTQTQEMYDELGPLILDLQNRGVLGTGAA